MYTLTLAATDKDSGFTQTIYQYVVAHDPEGGFAAGTRRIVSPPGAYAAHPSLTDEAISGFSTSYPPGAAAPTGRTTGLRFEALGLQFEGTSFDWLVTAGSKAMFKGTGTINGAGEYRFMLSVIDGDKKVGDPHRFRVRIWDAAT